MSIPRILAFVQALALGCTRGLDEPRSACRAKARGLKGTLPLPKGRSTTKGQVRPGRTTHGPPKRARGRSIYRDTVHLVWNLYGTCMAQHITSDPKGAKKDYWPLISLRPSFSEISDGVMAFGRSCLFAKMSRIDERSSSSASCIVKETIQITTCSDACISQRCSITTRHCSIIIKGAHLRCISERWWCCCISERWWWWWWCARGTRSIHLTPYKT